MRARLRVLLVAGLVLLAACGTDDDAVPETTTTAAAATQVTTAAAEEVTTTTAAAPTPTTEAPMTDDGPKRLVLVEWAIAENGWAIETDDAEVMTNVGFLEPLMRVGFDGALEPMLATSWRRVDDLTWEFTIREGVTFQDGEPLNAAAVANSLTYVMNQATPPRGFTSDSFSAIEATDEFTLTLRTAQPDALIPERMVSASLGILSPNAYGDSGPVDPFGTGTGPFVLVEEQRDQRLLMKANDSYWGGEVALDEVEVLFVPDPDVRTGMVRTGEADIVKNIPIPQLPILAMEEGVVVHSQSLPRTVTLVLNQTNDFLSDQRVREAISYGIDREALAEQVLEGAFDQAVGPFPAWEEWSNSDNLQTFGFDPDTARALLAEAGVEEGAVRFSLWTYNSRPELPPLAVAIQGMLADIGIRTDIRIAEYGALEPGVLAGESDLFLVARGHLVDIYQPHGFFISDYTCEGGYNISQYCDPGFDALVNAVPMEDDAAERLRMYADLSTRVNDTALSVFLAHSSQFIAATSRVENLQVHPTEHYILTKDLTVSG